ncbi:MAG: 3-dehydroquinate synthase [Phycisphaerae bacterium]
MTRTIRVELGDRSYDVRVGDGLLSEAGSVAGGLGNASRAVVLTDSNVGPLYAEGVVESLHSAGLSSSLITVPAGEAHKNLATFGRVFDELFSVEPAVDRRTLIVPLGGGVVGDMGGFVAATAMRGMRFLQLPTTLLADVDASVGGKTAVDHPAGKNLIGAFHQPTGVLIDVAALKTLPPEELRSGLAECVKHAFIRDASLLEFIESNAAAILAVEPEVMTELVARNVEIKAAVVAEDERESGVRAHLNFGHTIGHAIETAVGYGNMTHGQGVALGMIAVCELAARRGMVDASMVQRLRDVLQRLGLRTTWEGLDAGQLWKLMQHDKKARAGKVRMILPTRLGAVDIYDDTNFEEVRHAVASLE